MIEKTDILTLYTTCQNLMAIKKSTEKKAYLKAMENYKDFTDLLYFLLNPRIVTGISQKKINKKLTDSFALQVDDNNITRLIDLYDYLRANNSGRDYDIAVCQNYLTKIPEQLIYFVKDIITKNLKLGVEAKTVNAVYGKDFIPEHQIQQGSPRDKLRLKKGEDFWLTQKLNGIRGTYINGKIYSRQGAIIEGLDHITKQLNKLNIAFNCNYVYDGELIRDNVDNLSDNENFRIGTGIINSDSKDKSEIIFTIFDLLPVEEFDNGESFNKYKTRRVLLDVMDKHFKVFHMEYNKLKIVELVYHGNDPAQIDVYLDKADKNGWEGLMLNKDTTYCCKRNTGLIKIKTFKHSDLRIVNYEEGENKYKGMLGAIVVDYKGNEVNVGSGFTDEQRRIYWLGRDSLIGKIAQVKYKEESEDKKTGKKSLQFPIFEMIREDKNEASYE